MIHRQTNWLFIVLLFITTGLVTACGTISTNTVQLSLELTNRIKEIEVSHRAFVNTYFDGEIKRIDAFMKEKWTPLFLRNFLGTSQILKDLSNTVAVSESTKMELTEAAKLYLDDPGEAGKMAEELVKELNKKRSQDSIVVDNIVRKYVPRDQMNATSIHLLSLLQLDTPALLIMDFAEAANEQIRARRESLINPVELARKTALEQITLAYQDFYAGQGVITGRLEAAAKRNAQQSELIDSVAGKGTAAKINKRLNEFANDFNSAFEKIDNFYEKYEIDKSADDGGAGQMIDTFRKELDAAVEKYQK